MGRKHARNVGSDGFPVCCVSSCGKSLQGCKTYNQRCYICPEHQRAEEIVEDGEYMRFCHQCGRIESLKLFSGTQRSCAASLERKRKADRRAAEGDALPQQQSCVSEEQPPPHAPHGPIPHMGSQSFPFPKHDSLPPPHHHERHPPNPLPLFTRPPSLLDRSLRPAGPRSHGLLQLQEHLHHHGYQQQHHQQHQQHQQHYQQHHQHHQQWPPPWQKEEDWRYQPAGSGPPPLEPSSPAAALDVAERLQLQKIRERLLLKLREEGAQAREQQEQQQQQQQLRDEAQQQDGMSDGGGMGIDIHHEGGKVPGRGMHREGRQRQAGTPSGPAPEGPMLDSLEQEGLAEDRPQAGPQQVPCRAQGAQEAAAVLAGASSAGQEPQQQDSMQLEGSRGAATGGQHQHQLPNGWGEGLPLAGSPSHGPRDLQQQRQQQQQQQQEDGAQDAAGSGQDDAGLRLPLPSLGAVAGGGRAQQMQCSGQDCPPGCCGCFMRAAQELSMQHFGCRLNQLPMQTRMRIMSQLLV